VFAPQGDDPGGMPLPLKPVIRALLGASAAALAIAAPAQAAPLADTTIQATAASRTTCENPALSTPYAGIGDDRTYVLAPGGSFDDAEGWQLSGGASVESSRRHGGELVLPVGGSAISPSMCIDLDYPQLRFSHKVVGRTAKAVDIKVEVVYPQTAGAEWVETNLFDDFAGTPVGGGWRVSPDVDLRPQLGGADWGARDVALRFTAVPSADAPARLARRAAADGEVRMDDVFIDPRARF
jgi:hypothetical protein